MRAHNAEHLDSLPVLDVSALKHIAYVFDALIYYMRSGIETPTPDPDLLGDTVEPWNDQVSIIYSRPDEFIASKTMRTDDVENYYAIGKK